MKTTRKSSHTKRASRLLFCGDIAGMYNRRILQAFSRMAQEYFPVRFFLYDTPNPAQIPEIINMSPDGILVGGTKQTGPMLQVVKTIAHRLHIPVIDVSAALNASGFPRVISDDLEVGRMAARYFIERGFQHLAFLGVDNLYWSQMRWRGFREVAAAHGLRPEFRSYPEQATTDFRDTLSQWAKGLATPGAVFAANDYFANYLIEACCNRRIAVPEDIAVLGCDDDDLYGHLHEPQLSSVVLNTDEIGVCAMKTLHAMMRRRRGRVTSNPSMPPSNVLIPPTGIITRRSSDAFAVEDELVRRALEIIRAQIADQLSVKTLLIQLGVSRPTLVRRFAEALGRAPAAEISRVRFDLAVKLLREMRQSIEQIATAVGFASRRQFTFAFHRQFKMTPRAYRERYVRSLYRSSRGELPLPR